MAHGLLPDQALDPAPSHEGRHTLGRDSLPDAVEPLQAHPILHVTARVVMNRSRRQFEAGFLEARPGVEPGWTDCKPLDSVKALIYNTFSCTWHTNYQPR